MTWKFSNYQLILFISYLPKVTVFLCFVANATEEDGRELKGTVFKANRGVRTLPTPMDNCCPLAGCVRSSRQRL